jgi:penicillin-binding protein 2
MAHLLGYTGRVSSGELKKQPDYRPTDYIGKLGIEKSYESELKGIHGSEQTEVDAAGRAIKVLASRGAVAGSSLVLTIDQKLQAKLTESLKGQLEKSGAKKGSAVALDPRNGQVLASVSLSDWLNH